MYNLKRLTKNAIALGSAALLASVAFGAPPTPVSEMTKKELETHNRDAKEYLFKTQVTKDKANGLLWIQSPVVEDQYNPLLRFYFRTAIKEGKPVANYLMIMQTRRGIMEFDKNTYNYKTVKLGKIPLHTQVVEPYFDNANDAVTQQSTVVLDFNKIKSHTESGMHLEAINTLGATEIPIKASLVTAFVGRVEKELEKAQKKK